MRAHQLAWPLLFCAAPASALVASSRACHVRAHVRLLTPVRAAAEACRDDELDGDEDEFDPSDGEELFFGSGDEFGEELFFGSGDEFDPASDSEANQLDPSDPFYSEEVLISAPDVRTLRIVRPSNDAVLEQLMAQFQLEAMAEPARFNQIMQMRIEESVRNRPRTWYWSLVWPSAVALCRWLGQDPAAQQLVGGKAVLDLGCGIGVAGIGAVVLGGAGSVVLAEADTRALKYAAFSAGLNSVGSAVACRQLDWTAPLPEDLRASFSAILLSDVLYDADAAEPIARCAAAALSDDGVIILADQVDRPYSSASRRTALCEALEAHSPAPAGTHWSVRSSALTPVEWNDAMHNVQIAVVSRC
mmetsp:Transcript_41221/g.95473  ORF Transcript_41221/g.95473 Transcript_41221/m.95473 type:complete len:360 (-) Transcript_41221:238-1317(-)